MSEAGDLELFERAFHTSSAGCVRTCKCGRVFYNPDNTWDWEEGELERLEADPNAEPRDWSIGTLILDGEEYCCDCDCWRDRARKAVDWLDRHDWAITVPMPINGKVQCIDRCLADIVAALNAGGIETVASCCGHGEQTARVDFKDGRHIQVYGVGLVQCDRQNPPHLSTSEEDSIKANRDSDLMGGEEDRA